MSSITFCLMSWIIERLSACFVISSIHSAIKFISRGPIPRVVMVGVPIRTPLVMKGGPGISWDRVFIKGDVRHVKGIFEFFAADVLIEEADEEKVRIGSAADDVKVSVDQFLGEVTGVMENLFLIHLELGTKGFFEGDGFCGDDVHQGAALDAGEKGCIEFFQAFFFAED